MFVLGYSRRASLNLEVQQLGDLRLTQAEFLTDGEQLGCDALKADVESVVRYGFEGDVIERQHTVLTVLEVIRPERYDQVPLKLDSDQ